MKLIAVEPPANRWRPPHRSGRAQLTHPAPPLSQTQKRSLGNGCTTGQSLTNGATICLPNLRFPQSNQPSIKHLGTLSFHACAAIQLPLWPHPSLHEFRSFSLCQHGLYVSLCSFASSLLWCGLTSNTFNAHAYSNLSFRVRGNPLPPCWISQVPAKPILACCGSHDSEELQQHSRITCRCMWPSPSRYKVGVPNDDFGAHNRACNFTCQRLT